MYTCLVKLLTTFLLALVSLCANAESYYVSNNPATVSNVVEVIQGNRFVVDIAEPHPLAGNTTIFLAETYTPKSDDTCPNEIEQGVKVKEHISKQLTTANSIKLTHYRKTAKGAIARVSVNGSDLGEKLIEDGFASAEGWYWDSYYCDAYGARNRGSEYRNQGDYPKALYWFARALTYFEKDAFGKVYTSWGSGYLSFQATAMTGLGKVNQDMGNNQKALEWLTKALELNPNNSDVTEGLGNTNRELGNYEQAFKWWKQSAELGNSGSQAQLGHAYLYGEGTKVDLDQAEFWLTKAAEQGDDWAQRNLAEVYRLTGDSSKAASQYQVVIDSLTPRALQGDLDAIENLGRTYRDMSNYEKAIEWFKKGAERGHANIMLNLGWAYNELGNYETAFEWFKTSAELGNEWAQDSLGYAYLHGEGTTVDLDQAEYWLTKAVEQGVDSAQGHLAVVYIRKGDTDNAQKAIETMERYASNGDTNAMNELGWLYQNIGNNDEAFKWWKKSAELGDKSGMGNLGNAYLEGRGTMADLAMSQFWLTKAIEAGDEWAVINMGRVYLEAGSYPKALEWLTKGLDSAHVSDRSNAMKWIGTLYQIEGDTRKSVKWWQQAAELGEDGAYVYLGYAYLQGNGISRDLELAKKWLTKAAEQGDEWAQEGLAKLNE